MSVDKVIEARKVDYQVTFGSPAGQRVLEDLGRVCFVTTMDESCYAGDTNTTMFRLGCQEVWRHICRHLNLTTEQLINLYMPTRRAGNDRQPDAE